MQNMLLQAKCRMINFKLSHLNVHLKIRVMNHINITERTSATQPRWLTLLRVALGFTLFWKGITFIRNSSDLNQLLHLMAIGAVDKNTQWMAFVITYLNLLGGLFICAGLFTKTSCIVQIPILIGAVFFINTKQGLNQPAGELILSAIVLLLLIFFAIKGSGPLSADEYFRTYYKAGPGESEVKKP